MNNEEIEAKYNKYAEKTKEFILPECKEFWKKNIWDVLKKYSDFENNMDVAVEIMEKLENNATIDEIKELLNSSGIEKSSKTFTAIKDVILLSAVKGPEFYEQTSYEEISPEMKKVIENIKQRNEKWESTREERNRLEEGSPEEKKHIEDIKQRNEKYDKSVEQKIKRYEDFESYIEKTEGFLISNPNAIKGWRNNVEEFFNRGSDFGNHMDVAIEIMKKLENGATTDEIKGLLDNSEIDKSSDTFGNIRYLFLRFAEKGPEFYEQTAYEELSPGEKKYIEVIKQRNAKYDKSHEANSTEEISEERKIEEQEISDSFKEKENLKLEISGVEQRLASYRDKKSELKKILDQKRAENNRTEEK